MKAALQGGGLGDDFQERVYHPADLIRENTIAASKLSRRIAGAADHGGVCAFCCSDVPRRATVCASCGAVWQKEPTPVKDQLKGALAILVFVVSATLGISMESWIAFFVLLGRSVGLIIFSENALKGPEKHVWSRRN